MTLWLTACNSGSNGSINNSHADITTLSEVNTSSRLTSLHPLNIAYEQNPTIEQLYQVSQYVLPNGKPFFNVVILFAANINGSIESPSLYYNSQFQQLLNTNQGIAAIRALQNKGILVLMTYMGNHYPAGWSCLNNVPVERKLASQMVNDINKYDLDGIDIDDEWSTCSTQNESSTYNIVQAIKTNPSFGSKVITKALGDLGTIKYNYAKYLDGGWDMEYGSGMESSTVAGLLGTFQQAGIPKLGLAMGVDPDQGYQYTDQDSVTQMAIGAIAYGFGGIMVFDVNGAFPTGTNDAASYLSRISQVESGENVTYSGESTPIIPSEAPAGSYQTGAQTVYWDGIHLSATYDGITTPVLDYAKVCESGAQVNHTGSVLSCNSYAPAIFTIEGMETYPQGYWPSSCSIEDVSLNKNGSCATLNTQSNAAAICVNQLQAYCTDNQGMYVSSQIDPSSAPCYESEGQYWNIALGNNGKLYCPQ